MTALSAGTGVQGGGWHRGTASCSQGQLSRASETAGPRPVFGAQGFGLKAWDLELLAQGKGIFFSSVGLHMTKKFSKAESWFSSEQSVSQSGNDLLCFATGQDSRKVALEMVCPRVHPLSQVLQQERRVELRCDHVGGLQLWAETLQGEAELGPSQMDATV